MKKSNRIGIGGKPIGEAMPNQRKPKYQIPCSEYTNIMNQDHAANNAKILNTDKHLNLDLALNDYKPIAFKTTDDIQKILETHPEIQRLPKSHIAAIVAAIISALATGVGFALTIHLGGIGALAGSKFTISGVIKLAGATALANAGSKGFFNAVSSGLKGEFTWTKWGQDVGLAVATSLIVFPVALAAGALAGNLRMDMFGSLGNGLLIQYGEEAAKQSIENWIKIATSLVYGMGQGGMDALKQAIKEGKVNPIAVVVSLIVGAFSGYNIGKSLIDESEIRGFLEEQMRKLNDFFQVPANRSLLPEGVIKALIDHGPKDQTHAMERHGPQADIAKRAEDGAADVAYSRFSNVQDLYSKAHDAVHEGIEYSKRTLRSGWTKFEFDIDLSQSSINIDYALKRSSTNVIVKHFNDSFGGIVRTVVKIKDGEIPLLVTSFPKLGP